MAWEVRTPKYGVVRQLNKKNVKMTEIGACSGVIDVPGFNIKNVLMTRKQGIIPQNNEKNIKNNVDFTYFVLSVMNVGSHYAG